LLSRITQPITELVAESRREWKLPPHSHPNDAYSQLAQISQRSAEFEFPRQHLPQCFHFTGPYHNQASAASLRRCYAERGSQKACMQKESGLSSYF
jgi:hypothetical protein